MKRWQRLLMLASITAGAGALAWHAGRGWLGDPAASLDEGWHRGHRIVDRNGAVLRELPSEIGARGQPIGLEEMGDRLVAATLVSEDKRFFEHSGVDLRAIARAMGQNARHVRLVSGASTITQQLVKLLDTGGQPTREGRGLDTKIREAARAQNLEEQLSKRQILEAYLNRLSYGRGFIGPEAAARGLFGVSARELSWAQAALLAVLPRAPSYLDPYEHLDRAQLRQRALLDALHEQGFLSDADHARATAERIALRDIDRPFEAPHLTEALRLGFHGGLSPNAVTHTTIDLELQRDVEGLAQTHQRRLSDDRAHGAAVVVVDNHSGEVLAYVGSPGWNDEASGQIDMVRALRQPGSALKPFVYALAFERGLQPPAMLADVPTRFGEQSGAYAPDNFDGGFVGPISAREALAGSLNVPAVRLAASFEPGALLDALHALGFDSLDRSAEHYGLSLALGSGEVRLHELAGAYVTLARGGERIPLTYARDAGALGQPVAGERVMAADVAAAISDALSDPWARLRGLGGSGPFDIGFPVAVKTGTSSGHRDTYAVGYTHERTVAVWIGNPDGTATDALTGGSGAGPLFADAMRRAMRDVVERRPLWPADLLVETGVCPLSGLPAGDACPEAVPRRLIARHHHPDGARCTLHHRAVPVAASRAPYRCDPAGSARVVLLPDEFAGWLAAQPPGAPGQDPAGLPWFLDGQLPGCGDEAAVALRIDDPVPGTVLSSGRGDARVAFSARLLGPERDLEVEFVLDGEVVATSRSPYRADVPARVGDHVLEVRPRDPRAPIRIAVSHFSVR